eukprot:gene24571-10182_t
MSFANRLTELLNGQSVATALGVASRTGLLKAILSNSPDGRTAAALAEQAGMSIRYAQEILAALVCGKVVDLDPSKDPQEFALPADRKDALAGMGLYFEELPLLSQCAFDQVCKAAATGEGVPSHHYSAFSAWMGKLSNEKHEKTLVQTFLPSLDGGNVVSKLRAGGARVMDLGCGHGLAARLIAKAFPGNTIIGVDIDPPSIAAALSHPDAVSLVADGHLQFHEGDASSLATTDWLGSFDLLLSFDAIHDLPDPQGAMKVARSILKPGGEGVFAMVDIRARSGIHNNTEHPMAPFLYTVSLLHCMPQGLNHGGAGLGMMWGQEKAVAMLKDAGFNKVDVVEMEFDAFNDVYMCRDSA